MGKPKRASKPSICLALMVKDEAHIVKRLLDSVKPYIDAYAVLDTGSTDGTLQVIEDELQGFPGEVEESPFVNFAVSRNQLLDLARRQGCDYLFLLDADHVLCVEDPAVFNTLTLDSYLIRLNGDLQYLMPYLVKASSPFKYIGATHEYLSCAGGFEQDPLPGVSLDHYGDGGTRPEKFERDHRLLEEEFDDEPDNVRTQFYLAQTYMGMGETEKAIEMYKRRVASGGWEEEIYWSKYQIAVMTGNTDDYLDAWNYRPSRLEAVHKLAKKYNDQRMHHVAYALTDAVIDTPPTGDMLFVEAWVIEYGLLLEHGIACWYTGRVEDAKTMFEIMLTRDIPDHIRELTLSNLEFCK